MKTTHYNPSPLEVEFARIITELKDVIQERSSQYQITNVKNNSQLDNPQLVFTIVDGDGDQHELLLHFIQRADR